MRIDKKEGQGEQAWVALGDFRGGDGQGGGVY